MRNFLWMFSILIFSVSNLNAETTLTFYGGENITNEAHEENQQSRQYNVSAKPIGGLNLGVEYTRPHFAFGIGLNQRGAILPQTAFYLSAEAPGDARRQYNNISLYGMFQQPVSSRVTFLGGIQVEKCVGGNVWNFYWHRRTDINTEWYKTDIGILGGAQVFFTKTLGARLLYYEGLRDFQDEPGPDMYASEFRNYGVSLSLLYRFHFGNNNM